MSKRKRKIPPAISANTTKRSAATAWPDGTHRTPAQQEVHLRLMEVRRQRAETIAKINQRIDNLVTEERAKIAATARKYGPPICPHCGSSYHAPVNPEHGSFGWGVRLRD
jgi:hypothetical protein